MDYIVNKDMKRVHWAELLPVDAWMKPFEIKKGDGPVCPECGNLLAGVRMPAGEYSAKLSCACGFRGVVNFTVAEDER